jgi:hypothetical protein
MHRVDLDSTTLAWVRYSPEQLVMELGFRNGGTYAYFDVPNATYDELLRADSKGRYFNHHIRNNFRMQSVSITAVGQEN